MSPANSTDADLRDRVPRQIPWLWIGLVVLPFLLAGPVVLQLVRLRGTQRQTAVIRSTQVSVSLGEVVSGKHLEFHRPWLLRDNTGLLEMLGFRNNLPVRHQMKNDGVGVVLFGFASVDGMLNPFQAEFNDGRGWKTTSGIADWTTIRERPTAQDVVLFATGSIPRSSRQLQVRLLDFGGTTVAEIARFDFANPLYDPSAAVSAHSQLPVTAADRDLSVTLQQLVTGVRNLRWEYERDRSSAAHARLETDCRNGNFPKAEANELAFTAAELTMHLHGKPSHDWAVVKAHFRDPAGNEFDNNITNQANDLRIGTGYYYSFSPMMWTGEGPFRVTLDLARERNFAADELLTVTTVVPPAGMPPAEKLSASVGGTSVTFEGICGENYKESMGGGGNWSVAHPTAFLGLEERRGHHAMLTSAVAQATSQPVGMIPGDTYDYIATSAGPTRRRKAFGLWTPPAGTTITLTFAVTATRTVEFEAEPSPVK
ncbi:MAG: hypothetical protein ACR2IE_14830 [Candidatus Sumerlaeaceae bacterium]